MSKDSQEQRDHDVVARFTKQPTELPGDLRGEISELAEGAAVEIYAMADLGNDGKFSVEWVAIAGEFLVVTGGVEESPKAIPISEIEELRETSLPGGNVLLVLPKAKGKKAALNPLAKIRYTHRQRTAFGNLRHVIGERQAGRDFSPAADPAASYVAAVAHPIRKAQDSVRAEGAAVVWRLCSYLKPYSWQVGVGMGAAVLLALLALVPPYVIGRLLDTVITPFQRGALDGESAWGSAKTLLIIITLAYLIRQILMWVRLHTMALIGEYVARDLRRHVYDRVQQLSLPYFSKNQTGTVISRVTSDTDRIWEFIAFGVVEVSLSIITLIAVSGVLLYLDWKLALLMVAPIPLMLWAILWNSVRMQRLYVRAWRKWSGLTDVVAGTIPGMRIVKAFNQEDQERRRFGERNDDMSDTFISVHRNWTKFWPLLMGGIHLISIAVYWLAMPRLLSGGGDAAPGLSVGTFVSFLLFMGMFFQPIEVFGQMSRLLNRSLSSARRVFDLIDMEPDQMGESQEEINKETADPVSGEIHFKGVSFGYDSVRNVLYDLDFKIAPGQLVGIVGHSGAGKTTLSNLVPRFYDPTSGAVEIDGVDLRDRDIGDLRRQIGLVPQDPFLFHGTIADNIRYGLPTASSESIVEAARAANAHDFIAGLPHAYDTIVGERGHTLSGGERQRVAIARAVLHDPRILILDEATSSVDSETESKIQEALALLVEGRTTLVIAHRLSTLRNADRILVLEKGRLVEDGSHDALMKQKDGVYKKLYDLQSKAHQE